MGVESALVRRLREAATPDLYRRNAFRVLGAGVDAAPRELERIAKRREIEARVGAPAEDAAGPLPLESPPDARAVRAALERLRDPLTRFLDELFWFWPNEEPEAGSIVTRHNRAVEEHVHGLDRAAREGPEREEPGLARVLDLWHDVLREERFWELLAERIRALDDPRLPPDSLAAVRAELPVALVGIQAALALRAAERGDRAMAGRHLETVHGCAFESEARRAALRRITAAPRERLRTLRESAKAESTERAPQAARSLLEGCRPILEVLDSLYPDKHPERTGEHDDVALLAMQILVPFGNTTEEWSTVAEIFAVAEPIAEGERARERMQEALAAAKENASLAVTWRGPAYDDVRPKVRERLEQAREHAVAGEHDKAMGLLVPAYMGRPQPVLTPDETSVFAHALAYCLAKHAMRRVDSTAARTDRVPKTLQRALRGDSGFPGLGPDERDPADLFLRLPRLPAMDQLGMLQCDSCGHIIVGEYSQYAKVRFREHEFTLCGSCSNQLDREQQTIRQRFAGAIKDCGECLVLASELAPTQTGVKRHLAEVRRMARETGVKIGSSKAMRMRTKLATDDQLVAALSDRKPRVREIARRNLEATAPDLLRRRDRRRRALAATAVVAVVVSLASTFVYLQFRALESGSISALITLRRLGLVSEERALEVLRNAASAARYKSQVKEALSGLAKIGAEWDACSELALSYVMPEERWTRNDSVHRAAIKTLDDMRLDWARTPNARAVIPRLVRALKLGVRWRRNEARRLLPLIDAHWHAAPETRGVIPDLVVRLTASDWRQREAARETLERIDPDWRSTSEARAAVPRLKELAGDPRGGRVWAARQVLARIDPKQIETFPVSGGDEERDREIARRIHSLRTGRVRTLLELAKHYPLWEKSLHAKQALPHLVASLADPNARIRDAALASLKIIDPPFMSSAAGRWAVQIGTHNSRDAWNGLSKNVAPAWPALLRALALPNPARNALVAIAARWPEEFRQAERVVVPIFVQELSERGDPEAFQRATRCLSFLMRCEGGTAAALVTALPEAEWTVRRRIIRLLESSRTGWHRLPGATAAVSAVLRDVPKKRPLEDRYQFLKDLRAITPPGVLVAGLRHELARAQANEKREHARVLRDAIAALEKRR